MRSNVEALGMFPSESSYRHGPPLLDRVRVAAPFPGVDARMRPSDSPAASAPAVVALAGGLPRAERFSEPAARALGDARRAGGLGLGPPPPQHSSWTVRGLPGYWTIRVPRAAAEDPAGTRPPSPVVGGVAYGLQGSGPPGLPARCVFGAKLRAAHGLACLRIPGAVTGARARLATDRRGCALVGRDSHPLDDRRNFVTSPHSHSFPTSIAWSHPEITSAALVCGRVEVLMLRARRLSARGCGELPPNSASD